MKETFDDRKKITIIAARRILNKQVPYTQDTFPNTPQEAINRLDDLHNTYFQGFDSLADKKFKPVNASPAFMMLDRNSSPAMSYFTLFQLLGYSLHKHGPSPLQPASAQDEKIDRLIVNGAVYEFAKQGLVTARDRTQAEDTKKSIDALFPAIACLEMMQGDLLAMKNGLVPSGVEQNVFTTSRYVAINLLLNGTELIELIANPQEYREQATRYVARHNPRLIEWIKK